MASLRNLLGSEFRSQMGITPVAEPLHRGKVVNFNWVKQCCCFSCGLGNSSQLLWCVPRGVTRATFEAWGGGGGAASSCCCAYATPGTSGAYARRTVPVTPGQCFILCVGCAWGSIEYGDKRGCRGRWSAVCSMNSNSSDPGHVSMCAEGGYGGCAICNFAIDSGVTPDNRTGESCNFFGVDRPVFFPAESNNCVDCGPRAYGGDINICGRPGYLRYHCACNRAVKQHVPYPPYMGNGSGGWVVFQSDEPRDCALHHRQTGAGAMTGSYTVNWHTNQAQGEQSCAITPGMGKHGSYSCTTTCRYGTTTTPGMIRVTYWNNCAEDLESCGVALHMCG